MAGSYPDVPGLRMAHDRDGTVGFKFNYGTGGSLATLTSGNLVTLNDESSGGVQIWDSGSAEHFAFGLIFPELRGVQGVRMYATGFGNTTGSAVEWSANTTNGLDGTWTATSGYTDTTVGFSVTGLRTGITTLALTGVRAIRVRRAANATFGASSWNVSTFHVYGSPASGENPNRLRWWHPTLDQEITGPYFDLGDVARGSTNIVTFRIKNQSATLTANSVEIAAEALTDTSPTNVSQHLFSSDGATYVTPLSVGNLAPGAISSVLYMRRDTSASATLSLWWTRFVATATSWS